MIQVWVLDPHPNPVTQHPMWWCGKTCIASNGGKTCFCSKSGKRAPGLKLGFFHPFHLMTQLRPLDPHPNLLSWKMLFLGCKKFSWSKSTNSDPIDLKPLGSKFFGERHILEWLGWSSQTSNRSRLVIKRQCGITCIDFKRQKISRSSYQGSRCDPKEIFGLV